MKRNSITKLEAGLEKIAVIAAVILIWELLPRIGWVSSKVLPPFSVVLISLVKMLISGELMADTAISLERAFLGFAAAVMLGIPLGFILGWSEIVERYIDPLVELSRNTSILALYPLFILVFGLGELSKVGIIFWGALWPVLINTIEGVKTVDPLLIKSARSMGVSRLVLFFKVILPSIFPALFTGIRLGASYAIIILVAAEMLGASSGLGYLIFFAETNFQVPQMYAGIITLIILGVLINYFLVVFEKRISRWKEEISEA